MFHNDFLVCLFLQSFCLLICYYYYLIVCFGFLFVLLFYLKFLGFFSSRGFYVFIYFLSLICFHVLCHDVFFVFFFFYKTFNSHKVVPCFTVMLLLGLKAVAQQIGLN